MKEVLTEEERRRRRNEASRRCYLKRKAAQAAKNPKPKARAVEAKPAPRPAPKKGDPVAVAEKIVKKFAKTAAGVKPMLKDAAEFIGAVYKSEDQRVVEKVERILAKGLGVSFAGTPADPLEKTRVCLDAVSKAVKTPAFRLAKPAEDGEQFVPFPDPDKLEDEDPEPAEVPLDPETIEKIDAGEIAAEDAVKGFDDEDKDEDEEDEADEEDEDKDEDEDDEEDEDARRERDERRIDDDWASGRWDMMREMDAQGSFDD